MSMIGEAPENEAFAAAILGRPLASFVGAPLREAVSGRRILVTGAAGFIGLGLVRMLASLDPARIVLLDNGEHALYAADRALAASHPELDCRAVYCDVRDAGAISRCFQAERPELVFHAAALKQLPFMEAHPREAYLTNTVGARNVAEAAQSCGAFAMVQISTDKAVHCSSVLGATKRLAEAVCQSMDLSGAATRFVAVRFGNVFGSTGSVVPLFRSQIAAGGPVTLTDPRMMRYFMTLREACGLVLSATALAIAGGTRGEAYVLEMGAPVSVAELARRMILASGAGPDEIAIAATGIRPGERLSERVVHEAETVEPTPIEGVARVGPRRGALPLLKAQLAALDHAAAEGRDEWLCHLIGKLVPEFETGAGYPYLSSAAGS